MTLTDPTSLARPVVSPDEVRTILHDRWALPAPAHELGSQQDRNYLVESGDGRVVLKLAGASTTRDQLVAQHRALARLRAAGIRVPQPLRSPLGEDIVEVALPGRPAMLTRTLSFVEGEPLIDREPYGIAEAACIGDVAGRVVAALAGFDHPGARGWSQWDVREAGSTVFGLADGTPRPQRELVEAAAERSLARLSGVADALPLQVIHADLTDDNLVMDDALGVGVIDFGDLMRTWRIGELVAAGACAYFREDADALFLQTVRSFARHVRLTDAELTALWPLVVLRTAVLVVSGIHQTTIDGDNDYAQERMAAEWTSFEVASRRDPAGMEALIRVAAAGVPAPPATLLPPDLTCAVVDLSVTTEELSEGDWLDPGAAERVLRRHAVAGSVALTRWGEYRLTRTRPLAARGQAATLAVGVDVMSSTDLPLLAPFDGVLSRTPEGVVLTGGTRRLWIDGVVADAVDEERISTGSPLGVLPADALGRVQLSQGDGLRSAPFALPGDAEEATASSPDPSDLLGVDVRAPDVGVEPLLRRRSAVFADAQEHYYAHPPQIERGWREYLIDVHAQTYVDVVNNVTLAGHAHPGIVRAAARQWGLLNTNSRFHYEAVTELSERLAALAPEGLDRVFLVNSGSEAVDLALRLAMTATGRDRIVAAREAYHGWTIGADAVSTSIGDNPRALATRPSWVELLDAPNPVRGTHRGADSGPRYLADVDEQLVALGGAGRDRIAGVILEPIFGNGGGVLLPDGYVAGVYERIRALGGVCISDEVQVGYGRLGHHFWGFQQQGAVPDIIAVAKAMGNGQPLGAVITTTAIAEAFEQEGSFFSSAGGSPVSSRVGIAVLDAIEDDDLQGNARRVGEAFAGALCTLAETHPAIGAVHGMGLYLGLELVDPVTQAPATALAHSLCDALLEEGCIVQPTGDHKNVLKIKPPLCITLEATAFVASALDRALTAAGS
ncbi:aminotransferase [Microbacterium sp.]|uniref:aminotransferase n=1 Tax=Microbacterium sp. TaxID=51671 RepID=UPI003F706285